MTRKLVVTLCAAMAGAGLPLFVMLVSYLAWLWWGHGPDGPLKAFAGWLQGAMLLEWCGLSAALGSSDLVNPYIANGLLGAILVGGPTAVWQFLLNGNNENTDKKNQTPV